MINKLRHFLVSHEIFLLIIFLTIFVLVRFPGVDLPLHQDEYKWPIAVNPAIIGVIIPHPPLGEFIYRTAGYIVGFNVNFRFVPLFFGAMNLLLLYYLVRSLFGRREAVIASIIWIFSYFSVLASLMVDTDGEILPFFFLLSLIGYHKMQNSVYKQKILWTTFMVLGLVGGILIKLGFVLVIGAVIADFLWQKRGSITRKDLLRYVLRFVAGVVAIVVFIFFAHKIFPFFDLQKSVTYWKHFLIFFDRGWFQIFIQCAKAILYTSPFLVLVPILGASNIKENISKVRIFIFFLIFSFIFYIILFDFSIGALDRYLQLLILPLTVMSSVAISKIFLGEGKKVKGYLWIGIVLALNTVALQFRDHAVMALHPKSEWIAKILSLNWNFVYPFSGGSGPLGFYVSFFSISLCWIVSIVFLILALRKPQYKKVVATILIFLGIAYNGIFIEEYLFGFVNGSASKLVLDSVEFIQINPNISKVMVYNDNGAAEVQNTGKYHRRIYAAPQFESTYGPIFEGYKGHVLFIDIPRVDSNSMYGRFFASCREIYTKKDGYITAKVLDCNTRTL